MGAIVVDSSVSAGNWAGQKPKGYDSKDLDKAIKAYEGLAKPPSVTSFPTMPKSSIKEFETCIKTLETVIADMKKGVIYFKDVCDKLKAVSSAASKVSSDLRKQADDKDAAEKTKYLNAASAASAISAQASASQTKLA